MKFQRTGLALILSSTCGFSAAFDSSLSFSLHAHAAPPGFSATPMGWTPGAVAAPMNLVQTGNGQYYLRDAQPRRIRLTLPAGIGAYLYMYSGATGTGSRLQHVNDSSQFMYVHADYTTVGYFGTGRVGGPDNSTPADAFLATNISAHDDVLDLDFQFQTAAIEATQMPGRYVGQVTMVFDQTL